MQQPRANLGRELLATAAVVLASVLLLALATRPNLLHAETAPVTVADLAERSAAYADPSSAPGKSVLTPEDEKFLDDLQRRGIQFFLDSQDPVTGLMPDRGKADRDEPGDVASIASVGFGLTSIVIGAERGWVPKPEAYERCLRVIKFLRNSEASQVHGHFYHFLHMGSGERAWKCEVSNVDTALLLGGVLTARQYFPNTELARIADELYDRVEWPWLLTSDNTLSMGWHPEEGGKFIAAKWDHYSEGAPLILLLGIGSKTHPLPPSTWQAWRRDSVMTYAGLTFIQCPPLFTHQFPQCWFDLRGLRDEFANYFQNSQLATLAQRQWAIDELSRKFPTYGPNMWGITASDSADGYRAWGGPPTTDEIDGSVVPPAAAGSLAFQPRLCLDALKEMKQRYGDKAYVKYGFVDAFNPTTGWYNADVIGIDVGPSVVMAENCRSGFVWRTFMSSPEAQAAVRAAGFVKADASGARSTSSIYQTESRN